MQKVGVDPYEHTTEYSENETKWTDMFPVYLKKFEGLDPYRNTYLLGQMNKDNFFQFGLDPYENTYLLGYNYSCKRV